jgi:hypothetical protein
LSVEVKKFDDYVDWIIFVWCTSIFDLFFTITSAPGFTVMMSFFVPSDEKPLKACLRLHMGYSEKTSIPCRLQVIVNWTPAIGWASSGYPRHVNLGQSANL